MCPQLTIITATYNCQEALTNLRSALCQQTDTNFTWIVVDGMSSDGTTEVLSLDTPFHCEWVSERDFGIYDALNKGVRRTATTHYCVLGSDDRPAADFVERFRALIQQSDADIVAAAVSEGTEVILPGRGKPWLRGQNAYIAHHSVGVAIRTDLHERFGYYSPKFPIAADQLFIKRCASGGASIAFAPEFIAGTFSREGISSTDYFGTLCEFTRIQLVTEPHRGFQWLLFLLRLLKNAGKIVGQR